MSITVTPVLQERLWKQNGTNSYRIRICFANKVRYLRTNVTVRRDQVSRGKLKDTSVRYRIEKLVREVEEAAANIDSFALASMDIDQVVEFIRNYNAGGFRLDFVAFGREVAAEKVDSSRGVYNTALNRFCEFVGRESFDISSVTSALMREWEDWLVRRYGRDARCVSSYTACISFIHGQARRKYNKEELGITPIKNPFLYYKPPRQKASSHKAADEALIQRMIDLRGSLSGRERLGVDAFLISFALMGMNAPDLYSCAAPKDGVITYNRTKTKNLRDDHAEMRVRLSGLAGPLFEEYADGSGSGLAFDFSSRYANYKTFGANVNKGLLKFCERVGHKKVTLYWARHGWGTIAMRAKVNKWLVNDCLCHVDKEMKVTDIYIEKDWSLFWEANETVLSRFDWHF